MPTELEELVGFLNHGNTSIRQIAVENLVPYSTSQPSLFKYQQMTPVGDLKLLIRDYGPIAKNAITILINISDDKEVLTALATDDAFVDALLTRLTNAKEPNANELSMLLANLAKHDHLKCLLTKKRPIPPDLSSSALVMDQLLDLFVKGSQGKYNKEADYNYLSYFFADMAKYEEGRKFLLTSRTEGEAGKEESVVPLTKLIVFTEFAPSAVRRRGVASTIKNVCFEVDAHAEFLDPHDVSLLPYILLPLMGGEEYSDEDTEGMLDELQLLEPDKTREPDLEILKTHLETLLLLTTTKEARETMRRIKVYPIVRETHFQTEDEGVREVCDRVVQVLMRDEAPEGEEESNAVEGNDSNALAVKADELGIKQIKGDKVTDEIDEDEEIIDIL